MCVCVCVCVLTSEVHRTTLDSDSKAKSTNLVVSIRLFVHKLQMILV